MSRAAVTSGQTKPSEILTLLKKGVLAYSVANLHAKVFVVGARAFVGSANVSGRSATALVEAAIEITDRKTVTRCRHFVHLLRGEPVTQGHAKAMQKLYVPPKSLGGGIKGRTSVPTHSPCWAVPLEIVKWDTEDRAANAKGLKAAKARRRSPKSTTVQSFCWSSGVSSLNRMREKEDLVVQVVDEGRRRVLVSPPGRLLSIRRYQVGREGRAIVYLEVPRKARARRLARLVEHLGPACRVLGKMARPRLLRNRQFVHNLLNAWPSSPEVTV